MTTELILLPVADEQRDALLALLHEADGTLFTRPASTGLRTLVRADDGAVLAVVEWASKEAHDTAAASEELQTFFGRVAALASGPPRIEFYDPA